MNELPDGWREQLPDEMKSNGILDTVKTIDNLVKMAIDGRVLATTSIRIPSSDASADDQKAFRTDLMTKIPDLMFKPDMQSQDSINEVMKTMGMPDDHTGYTLPDMPEGIKESITGLSKKAHSAGVTQNQFSAITEGILDDFKTNSEVAHGAMEAERNVLKNEWGAAYDQKIKTISHFAKQTGFSEDFISAINDGKVDSTNMKAFETVVDGYKGGAIEIGRQPNNPEIIMTPQEADARLDEMMANKEHAYWNAEDPQHKAATDKAFELEKLAAVNKQTESDKFRHSLQFGDNG